MQDVHSFLHGRRHCQVSMIRKHYSSWMGLNFRSQAAVVFVQSENRQILVLPPRGCDKRSPLSRVHRVGFNLGQASDVTHGAVLPSSRRF